MRSRKQVPTSRVDDRDLDSLGRQSGDRWITMSNALTRAGHGLTLAEKRLVMLAVSKIDSTKIMRPGEALPLVKITAQEYAEAFGLDPTSGISYEALRDAGRTLYNRSITFFEPAYKRNGQPLAPIRTDMRWVDLCKYHPGEGWIQFSWCRHLLPSLVGLQKQFTSYQLQQASALRSAYSWRLLELLMRFKSSGVAEYTVEDFTTSMDAPPSLRIDFGQVKRRIIEPAIKELTEKDGWIIQWEPIKKGRKVDSIRFEFMRHTQVSLQLEPV